MQIHISEDTFNLFGEFRNKELEKEFFSKDMNRAIRYIKPIIIILGILNTLFLIPDYFFVGNKISFYWIVASRFLFLTLVVTLVLLSKNIKQYRMFAYCITAYEFLGSLLFLVNFYLYEDPDFYIQAFGVIVILFSVFLVPNRWLNMITVSLFISIGFLTLSLKYIDNITTPDFLSGLIYLLIILILCCIFSYRNHYYKRVHYINSKELERLAITDPLTGVYNRIKLDDELEKWSTYAKRHSAPLSIAILDFDEFKNINDTYGHLEGDNVIKESVNCIKRSIRATDIFARWGGEEFVVLLPNTDLKQALELIECLRHEIEICSHEVAGHVTCSFGVAQFQDHIDNMLRNADQKLYLAKSEGKNNVRG